MKKRFVTSTKVYFWERKKEIGWGIFDTEKRRFAPYFVGFPLKERTKVIKRVRELCKELNDNPRIYFANWLSWCRVPKEET